MTFLIPLCIAPPQVSVHEDVRRMMRLITGFGFVT